MKDLDWAHLKFGYMKTDWNVRIHYQNGAWGEIEECDSEFISIHMAATCLHYGQEAFEGLKAFRGKNNCGQKLSVHGTGRTGYGGAVRSRNQPDKKRQMGH